jgi:PAS domain S-box-containing protein
MSRAPRLEVGDPGAAEDAVRFLATILEASTEHSMIVIDLAGRIVGFNAGARRIYGYPPSEIIGAPYSVLHIEPDVEAGLPEQMMERALEDGSWKGIVERQRKDGSRFMGGVVITPRRSGKDLEGFLIISSDVTDELRLSRELERTRSFAETLVESAPDAMVMVNPDGTIRLVNAELERVFGYGREELLGQPMEVLIPQRQRAAHQSHRRDFFAAPANRPMGVGLKLSGRRSNGAEFPVEISLSPFETEEGVLATAAIRDVTERIEFERALRDTNLRLENASRAKDRFLASMSHELRTPLNAIIGFTGTLLMGLPGPLNDEQTKQLGTVRSSGRHLLSLINDLLDLARIESGKVELHPEPIACRELLEEVARGLRPLAEEKQIALEVLASGGVEVECDRRALSQILINLTSNAIKFTDQGHVRLTLTCLSDGAGGVTRFSVLDTGRGIKSSDQERLFAAFEQVGEPGATPFQGTGLGLYICQTLANLLGAEIGFASELGHGSVFTLDVRGPP